MQPISRDGRIRVYTHPNPALQITFEVLEETRYDRMKQAVQVV